MSLQNYPDSAIISGIMDQLKDHVLFVICAGNNSSSGPNYPAYYSSRANVMSVGSSEVSGVLSSYSDWGSWVNICGFGTLFPNLWGTSFAAPQGAGFADLLLALNPDMGPALVKKILLNGGLYQSDLSVLIGDPAMGLQGRTLNGGGALKVLQRLEGIFFTGYDSPTSQGAVESLSVSEDSNWLSQFSLQVQLVDSQNRKFLVPATVANSRIAFVAPAAGGFTAQLVIEGSLFGNKLPLNFFPALPPHRQR